MSKENIPTSESLMLYTNVKEHFEKYDVDQYEIKRPQETVHEELVVLLVNNGFNIRYLMRKCKMDKDECTCGKDECMQNRWLRVIRSEPGDQKLFSMAWMYR